jgi:hypothetical protein
MFETNIHKNEHEGQGDYYWQFQRHKIVAQEIKVLLEFSTQPKDCIMGWSTPRSTLELKTKSYIEL